MLIYHSNVSVIQANDAIRAITEGEKPLSSQTGANPDTGGKGQKQEYCSGREKRTAGEQVLGSMALLSSLKRYHIVLIANDIA